MSSKGPQSPQDVLKGLQNVPTVLSPLNNPQKVIKVVNVLKGSTKSSYPQNVIKVLKTSSKCSQIPQVLSRSSDPRNVLNVPKVLESPQKQIKVNRFSGPQFQERSWKDPQKVLKSYSNVLKRASKSSRCSESLQNVPTVLSSLNNPQ